MAGDMATTIATLRETARFIEQYGPDQYAPALRDAADALEAAERDLTVALNIDVQVAAREAEAQKLRAGRTETMAHLGDVLSLLEDLDEGDRCEALDSALAFYNQHNPDAIVAPSGICVTYLVHKHPVLGICELTKRELGITAIEAEVATLRADLDEAVGLLRILATGNYLERNDAINNGVPAFLAAHGGSA